MQDRVISSTNNPVVKTLADLQSTDGRRRQGMFLVEGRRAIDGFIVNGWTPIGTLLGLANARPDNWPEAESYRLSEPVWRKISRAATPSEYGALFSLPPSIDPDEALAEEPSLALVGVSDPGNLGTLMRSALAFSWRQLLLIGGVDPFAPKVIAASAGALPALRIRRCPLNYDPQILAAQGQLLALVPRGGSAPAQVKLGSLPILAVGSEAHGLPAAWLECASSKVTLPMAPGVESLNAAMAASIACWALSPAVDHQSPKD
ncbi:MAG: RNA methyltransferase [Planctomycetota bacterium]|nr:MAG: RNA methyltransferase [Planctomycetota bacterium]